MRVAARVSYSLQRLKYSLAGFLLVLVVASTQAADYIPSGQPVPQGIKWVNATATGADTSAWARVGTTTSKFPVPVSSSTLGKLAGAAVRRGLPVVGWGLVLRDLVNGAGWVIDELQGQVMDGPVQNPEQLTSWSWCTTSVVNSSTRCTAKATPTNLCFWAYTQAVGYTPDRCESQAHNSPNSFWLLRMDGLGRTVTLYREDFSTTNTWPNEGTGNVPVAVTDTQLGDLVKANPQVVNAILIDPDTGAPIRFPELINALNALAAANAAANGLDPPTPVPADPTYGEEPTPSQTDWPGFCDWATTVCDFIDWFKNDPEEQPMELPETQLEIEPANWSSGIGEGSCPAPIGTSVTIMGSTADIEFEWTPMCVFATTMRPFVLIVSAIGAAFIIAGLRNSGSSP